MILIKIAQTIIVISFFLFIACYKIEKSKPKIAWVGILGMTSLISIPVCVLFLIVANIWLQTSCAII